MKRLGRMTSLETLTGLLAHGHPDVRIRDTWLSAQAAQMFGTIIAGKVDRCRLRGSCLILNVKDPAWRKELARDRGILLDRARNILPDLKTLVIAE